MRLKQINSIIIVVDLKIDFSTPIYSIFKFYFYFILIVSRVNFYFDFRSYWLEILGLFLFIFWDHRFSSLSPHSPILRPNHSPLFDLPLSNLKDSILFSISFFFSHCHLIHYLTFFFLFSLSLSSCSLHAFIATSPSSFLMFFFFFLLISSFFFFLTFPHTHGHHFPFHNGYPKSSHFSLLLVYAPLDMDITFNNHHGCQFHLTTS